MNNTRDPSRLRLGLNPLLTTSLGPGYSQNTPLSAVSLASNTQYPTHTPPSAIQPYNPQEWIASPVPGAERTHGYGHEQPASSPLPPPPYSPPRSQRPVSQSFEPVVANTSAVRVPPSGITTHRPSPDPPANSSFPPPPNAPGRGASRERRLGLSSLTRRRDYDQNPNPSQSTPDSSFPRNANRNLAIHISQPEPQRFTTAGPGAAPPNARRAVSVGAIETPTSSRSRSSSQVRWEPGMPLPPPPPGPPPSQSRSQSLQPSDRTTTPVMSPPTRRPPPSGVMALGPVPPTPANWVDEDARDGELRRGRLPGLTIDTSSASVSSYQDEPQASGAGSAGLARTGAIRQEKSIRQRRAESKTRGPCNPTEFSDIVVPNGPTLSRRLTVNKSTPRSAGRSNYEQGEPSFHASRNTTPRIMGAPHLTHAETSTPPFSPKATHATPVGETSASTIPKALPTPPPRIDSASSDHAVATPASSLRPPPSGASIPPTRHSVVMQSSEQFSRETIDRFKLFAAREAAAETDVDRVRIFADFMVSESRIRRERYGAAITTMGSEIFDLTRDLFRPMEARRESGTSWSGGEWTPQSNGQINSAPASATIPDSPAAAGTPTNNPNWGTNNYMPSLSPILSMSNVDDSDSRGRPASRWWESDSNGAPGQRLERSKRESKYMGVPKEAREALQWIESPKKSESYGAHEYESSSECPLEKKMPGLFDHDPALTPHAHRRSIISTATASLPSTPNPPCLDISRLVTLPPPYPRHHPAVNNNHPDLAEVRASVRTLSDLSEVTAAKERFQEDSERRRQELKKQNTESRQALRLSLQEEINSGRISYADAAVIDADATKVENDKIKDLEKADFEQFQKQVVGLTNDLLTTRIAQATQLLEDLTSRLFDDTGNAADMPQEEGDDKPELLEKLTLFKWIFEAREGLHKAIFDLLSDRNDRYKAVIMTPYRLSGNEEKLRQADAFFVEDVARRTYVYATEMLQRAEAFEKVVSDNVSRGVEVQLSAFWDIAPNISRLLERIPGNLLGFRVQIPPDEVGENPAYHDHPLQYLFSLLLHAEKSTYQFIESQTNLLCLLHEVREAVTNAKARVIETEMDESGALGAEREGRAERVRAEDAARLTDDLKGKVKIVQDQWNEALGEAIRQVKERVGGWLLETGGWDEQLEDGGVGVS